MDLDISLVHSSCLLLHESNSEHSDMNHKKKEGQACCGRINVLKCWIIRLDAHILIDSHFFYFKNTPLCSAVDPSCWSETMIL